MSTALSRAAQAVNLGGIELPPPARCQALHREAGVGRPVQVQHRVSHRLAHPAHLPIAALVDAKLDPARSKLAQLYAQKNKFREAAAAARKAYDMDPKPQYAGLLARSLLRIGRTQEALDIYKKAIGIKDAVARGFKK